MHRVLLIEDSPLDAARFRAALGDGAGSEFAVEHAASLSAAEARLRSGAPPDVAVLDLTLPESQGIETLERFVAEFPHLPTVVLSGKEDVELALRAVREGAVDYLFKGELAPPALLRSLLYAIERGRLLEQLRSGRDRFHQLVEQASDAFFVLSSDGVILDVNRRASEMLGFGREELLALHVADLDPDYQPGAAADVWDRVQGGAAVTVERRLRARDGRRVPVEVRLGLFEAEGRFLLALVRDVTEREKRREAEQALRVRRAEFRVARDIQQRLFPRRAPACRVFELAGASHPADETGGDYYDFLALPGGRLGLAVGDVGGHGLGAALLMVQTRAYLRALAPLEPDPGRLLTRLNAALCGDTELDRLVTLFWAVLDPAERSLRFAGAGHRGWLLSAGAWRLLATPDVPLGVDADVQYASQGPCPLAAGELLLLFTDGLSDAVDAAGAQWGEPQVLAHAAERREQPAAAIVAALLAARDAFAASQDDDVTVAAVRVAGSPKGSDPCSSP